MYDDTEEVERRMKENLSPEERFLLTRLALQWVRAPYETKREIAASDKKLLALMDAAERLGFGDIGTQLMAWAEKQTVTEQK